MTTNLAPSGPKNIPFQSLVQYDTPVLVSDSKKKDKLKKPKPGSKVLPPVESKGQINSTESILNSILPPREWDEEGHLWTQSVSSTPATRLDVRRVQEQLDQKLLQRQARESGICPVREELYAQCFDELIRQVTVNCAERGLLLLRVRDEVRMTIAAYRTLYESSVAFGMRKALLAEQGKAEMQNKIKELEEEKEVLERKVAELNAKCEAIEKREAERRKADEKKHEEDMTFLRKQNQQYKNELERLIAPKK